MMGKKGIFDGQEWTNYSTDMELGSENKMRINNTSD
jgi:hypothetical protein